MRGFPFGKRGTECAQFPFLYFSGTYWLFSPQGERLNTP